MIKTYLKQAESDYKNSIDTFSSSMSIVLFAALRSITYLLMEGFTFRNIPKKPSLNQKYIL